MGDRFLYRRTPMLRGDDVAELQQRLCTLGFDTGRVDGIFGDATVRALDEFQRNAGLPVDGIVGGATLLELVRLESRHHEPALVSAVRARAALRDAPPTLRGRHIAVGESGGLGSVTGALRRRLTWGGIRVTELHHPDDAVQAKEANELGVDVFVGLRLNPSTSGCRTAFWSGRHDESLGGRRLAELVQAAVPEALRRHRRRRARHVGAPAARDAHACSADRGGAGQPRGRGYAGARRRPGHRARALGRRLLGLITGNHNAEMATRGVDLASPRPRRRLRDQCFRQVNEVTIHNVMHRLWMKLYRPLTVV